MKILIIHNCHRSGSVSGDDQVFINETKLLESHGNTVIRYTVSNDEFDRAKLNHKILQVLGMIWSKKHYRAVQTLIQTYHPDVVHIHTFFPLLSPSVLYAAKDTGLPVVATLHDTRFICPAATSLRKETLCNECMDGHYFRMYRYRCFKGSRIQSFIVACAFTYHRRKRSFYRQIDRYICLNDTQINLLKQAGFDQNKIVKKYNFYPDNEIRECRETPFSVLLPERFVLFFGRIGIEKGIRILEKAWEQLDIPLVVMGTGPLEDEFREWSKKHPLVQYIGYKEHEEALAIVKKSDIVVFPSIWYEGCSMVEIEAEGLGKPLIASDLGFSAELVQPGYNGLKVKVGNPEALTEAVQELWIDPARCKEMGKNARADFEARFRKDENYRQLMKIYSDLCRMPMEEIHEKQSVTGNRKAKETGIGH